jgi:chloramphenicol-sensitive protein RarD
VGVGHKPTPSVSVNVGSSADLLKDDCKAKLSAAGTKQNHDARPALRWQPSSQTSETVVGDLSLSKASSTQGILLALVAYFIWGVSALYWIETQPVSPVDVMAHRALWTLPATLVVLLALSRLRSSLTLFRNPKVIFWGLLASLLLAINWGTFLYAVTSGKATEASLGYFMLPLLTILVGMLVFGERPKRVQQIAIALAVVAVGIQIAAYGSLPWVSLTVASTFAIYGAIRKQIEADAIEGLFLEALCMAPFAALWLIINDGAGFGIYGLKVDLFLLFSGVYTAVPLLTFVAASRILQLSTIGLLTYIGPTLQLLVAQFILDESIDTVTVATFCLVWVGVILVAVDAWRQTRR